MRRTAALTLTALLLTAGCSSSGPSGPDAGSPGSLSAPGSSDSGGTDSSSAPAAPACDDVWAVGQTLPADYATCATGSAVGPQDVTECLDGSRLIVFDDALWATTGGTIIEPDVSPLQDTEAYGAAYGECTGE